MDKALNLLGCPFCGNDVVHVQDDYCGGAGFMVLCGNCTAEGGLSNTEKEAAEVWNRRATSTAAPDAGREGAVQTGEKTLETRMDASSQPLFATVAAPGELPPLPDGDEYSAMRMLPNGQLAPRYTPTSMRAYAAAAVAADRAQRAAVEPAPGAGIDGPEFQELLDEFAYRASERRAMGGDFASAKAEGVAEEQLIAHIDAKLQEARMGGPE